MPPTELAWDPDSADSSGWKQAVESWPWEPYNVGGGRDEGWKKSGTCPRCGHHTTVYQLTFLGVNPITTVPAGCDCRQTHPGRPDDAHLKGCGPEAAVAAAS